MMPVSVEYAERLEDDIAESITAIDDLDEIRHLLRLVHKYGGMTDALYRDSRARLDRIATALETGKRNTAALRNGGRA